MRRTLILAAVLLALLLVAVPVQAEEESGQETIYWLEHHAVEIDNTDGKQMKISYDVQVTSGVNVNIYFMDEDGYDDFTSFQNFTYFQSQSRKDTDGANVEWTWNKEGTFYVVIENAGWQSIDETTFDYEVTWDEGGGLWWGLPLLWCLIILLIVAVIGIATIWLVMAALKARRESTAEGTRGEGGSTSPPPGEGGPGTPGPGEEVTSPDALVLETMPIEGADTTPVPTTVPGPGEGAAELGPQPEPPDSPTGTPADSGYRGTAEPPAPGTTTYPADPVPTGEGVTQLSPQPEPPDMPAHTTISPTGEGTTQLSPQPEPPDMPAHTTISPTGEGATQLSPQPEPPDMPAHATITPTGEGATQLSPQPEPPDMEARGDGLRPEGDGKTKLGPQPEPPD